MRSTQLAPRKKYVCEGKRNRDIFPLPPPTRATVKDIAAAYGFSSEGDICVVYYLSYSCTAGLDALADASMPPAGAKSTSAQRAVQTRIAHKVARMCLRLIAQSPFEPRCALKELIKKGDPKLARCEMKHDMFDLLETSASVDPLPDLEARYRDILTSPKALFTGLHPGIGNVPAIHRNDRVEYTKLVGRQLRAGKVIMALHATTGAGVFPVGKPSGRMREVWNGSELSSAATTPPVPPHLASPTALLNLEVGPDQYIYVCKRDARVYFDQLRLPEELRRFFGRPAVRAGDLARFGGVSWCEIKDMIGYDVADQTLLYPLCTSFPMGFSWSSFVAQTVLLARCFESGLDLSKMLSDSNPCPRDMQQTFAVATDDVMIFTVGGPNARNPGAKACARLDNAIGKRGIQGAPEKDINDKMDATVIGIDVSNGRYLCPAAKKLALIMSAASFMFNPYQLHGQVDPHERRQVYAELGIQPTDRRTGHLERDVHEHVPPGLGFQPADSHLGHSERDEHADPSQPCLRMSPLELAAILGSFTHFAMLNRPTLSSFHSVYEFTGPLTADREPLSLGVMSELGTFLALSPLIEADMRRPWQSVLVATDASQSYGYRVSMAPMEPGVVRTIGRVGERPNQFVRLERDMGPSDEPEKPRKGVAFTVPLAKSAFRTVVMSRARFKAHSSTLETGGVALGLR